MINLFSKVMVTILTVCLMSTQANAASTSLLKVNVRYDRKYDFSQMDKTFQWIKRKDSSREYVDSIDPDINEFFLSTVNEELIKKGFDMVHDGSASIGVDYVVIINKEGNEASLTKALSDIRKRRYSKTHIPKIPNIEEMKEGTIIVNIVDMNTGYLIWIGYADAIVVAKKNREELLEKVAAEFFSNFPPK